MGSFNVACSMSNISIGCGTKVAFFPLIANWADYMEKYYGIKNDGSVKIGPKTQLVSNDGCLQLYGLFSLPIFGTYNDYGGVENIEESVTTKIIEDYFGITIDEFMDCATNSRTFYDYFSGVFCTYVPEDKRKLLSDYHVKFTPGWMEKIGMEKVKGKKMTFSHPSSKDLTVTLKKWTAPKEGSGSHYSDGYIYVIYKDGEEIFREKNTYDIRENFLTKWHELTSYYLMVSEENQKRVVAIQNVGGMFVHYDIYRHLVESNISEYGNSDDMSQGGDADLNDYALKLAGFEFIEDDKKHHDRYSKLYMYPGVEDYAMLSDGTWSHVAKKNKSGNWKEENHGTYNLNQLIEVWEKLTGVKIEIPEAEMKVSKYSAKFDELQKEVKKYVDSKKNEDKMQEVISRVCNDKANEKDKEMAELFWEEKEGEEYNEKKALDNLVRILIRLQMAGNPLDYNAHCGFYTNASLSGWNALRELYTEAVADGSVKQDLIDYNHFYWNAYQNNRIFMPQSNGCQFGNHYATRALAKKVYDIMDAEIKEYDEEYA